MGVLTLFGVFAVEKPATADEPPVYTLTPVSRLLVGPGNLAHMMSMTLHPSFIAPFLWIGDWLQREQHGPCMFEHTHGKNLWEAADGDAAFNAVVNEGMASDSAFVMDIVIKEHGEVFRGITSLVDVAGGNGTAERAIADCRGIPGEFDGICDNYGKWIYIIGLS
uniref:O-methyltransferase C-terminal domain-containing protein n=1 Tax=Oryza glumipatula TaxID=40148 RepID=A0A0E0BSF8_9ORYZ